MRYLGVSQNCEVLVRLLLIGILCPGGDVPIEKKHLAARSCSWSHRRNPLYFIPIH